MFCLHCNKESQEKSRNHFPELSLNIINLACKHTLTEKTDSWKNLTSLFGSKDKLFNYQGLGYEFAKDSDFRCLIADEPGLGKGQILTDKILTPIGWKSFKDIHVGDIIIGKDGKSQTITGIFDRGILPSYRVTFTDYSSVTVDGEHLWSVNTSTRISRNAKPFTKQTNELVKELKQAGKLLWRIPLVSPIEFNNQTIPINPYILGLLLGDGSFATPSRVRFSSKDEELICAIEQVYNVRHDNRCNYSLSSIISLITSLGLAGTKSDTKFIPEIYKFNSINTRMSILQGLMDTDGSIWNNGVIEYTTCSKQLKDDIVFLVESLGGICKVSARIPSYRYKGKKKHGKASFRIIINIPINPFRLKRKANLYTERIKYKPCRIISSIEYAGEQEIRCISVSNPDKLYITNNCIVTHNTMQALACIKLNSSTLTPTLIIVKSALKIQWARQILRWLGIDFQPQIISDSKEKPLGLFPIVIVTYDILWRVAKKETDRVEKLENELKKKLGIGEFMSIPKDKRTPEMEIVNPFKEFGFQLLILDEVQQIKNQESQRARQVRTIAKSIPHVIALSGTPIKNNAGEYFTILNIIKSDTFSDYKSYITNDCDYYWNGRSYKIAGIRDLEDFQRKTKSFIIRRTREEVMPDLPKLLRKFVECDFASKKMQEAYQNALDEFNEFYESANEKNQDYYTHLLAKMAKLRHLAGMNKIPFTIEWIEEFILDTPKDRKVVIFAHHLDVQEILRLNLCKKFSELRETGIEINDPIVYTSDLNAEARQAVIDDFCNLENNRVLIGSTLAMGEGVDGLQRVCKDFIILERQWNPANEEQVEGRFVRIGAEINGSISGSYILSVGTIDEYFTELVEQKRATMSQVLDGKEYEWNETSLIKDLAETLNRKGLKKWSL